MLHGLIMRRARRYFRLASPGASSSGEGFALGGAGGQGGALEFDVARCFEMVPFNGAQVRLMLKPLMILRLDLAVHNHSSYAYMGVVPGQRMCEYVLGFVIEDVRISIRFEVDVASLTDSTGECSVRVWTSSMPVQTSISTG
jgi:hypothetical protein